ncbi:YwpF-like family protein [Staphylococcus americanisciuri]|uniref:YwpF-like family protein n=1 Tax=Staphylococcus americanisciuri TaxID=2973940 RepID=A0ABT2F3N3_9STAP|nr:YwpF-like family protein [Staphylococcus americanisciuri]MCS4487041.1 YwpF-like family protein [Staphylococcus americanisciuri]
MKTFKAVRFQIVSENSSVTEYELLDGVIINKEDRGTGWLLEIVISDIHKEEMTEYMMNNALLNIRVVITRPSNDPALFDATIKHITQLQDKISVIFECHIYTLRQVYAENLLEQLVAEGLEGEALTKTFNRMMQSKPRLKDERQ